jgi:hypothetical protein
MPIIDAQVQPYDRDHTGSHRAGLLHGDKSEADGWGAGEDPPMVSSAALRVPSKQARRAIRQRPYRINSSVPTRGRRS